MTAHYWSDTQIAFWRNWHTHLAALLQPATDLVIEAAQLEPGMRVLDLASGTGNPALDLARLLAPDGQVVATDINLDLLSVAMDIARQAGLTNVSFEYADAQSLPFDGQSFDRVTVRFGVMFIPDIDQALGEIHRVLKPDGRVAFVVWGSANANPYLTLSRSVSARYTDEGMSDPASLPHFRFAARGSFASRVEDAGFRQVEDREHLVQLVWPSTVADLLTFDFSRTTNELDKIPAERRNDYRQELMTAYEEFSHNGQVKFPAKIIVVAGRRS